MTLPFFIGLWCGKTNKRLLPGEKLSPKATDVGGGTTVRLLKNCGEFVLR